MSEQHPPSTPRGFYSSFTKSPNIQNGFEDIDNADSFKAYLGHIQNAHTCNFVLDFGNENAWCAVNLEKEDLEALLSKPKPTSFGTRWINIWNPEEQKDLIKTITRHYGVSERLQGMMCTDPVEHKHQSKQTSATQSLKNLTPPADIDRSPRMRMDDIEEAYELKEQSDTSKVQTAASFRGLTFSHVTNQIWHFCSVDHGPKYTCIGYNSLYIVPNVDVKNGKHLPDGKRLWSWLLLCNDGTVISIQENPYPGTSKPSESELKAVLGIVRRNIQFVFAGISKQHSASSESDSLVTIRVRPFHDVGPGQTSIKQEDGPSLLFYYIFDDWPTSYALVSKREHRYGVFLDQLRENMLAKPDVNLVHELHWLGRRLGVLKRLYQSYELIMMRLLQRQRQLRDETRASLNQLPVGNMYGNSEMLDIRQEMLQSSFGLAAMPDKSVGIQLSSAAVARFERLLDRIKLYCLSELDTCLLEKESLTFLNFNLIALKDSQAVEKLTRITVLLAKVTILFLPVSLMTGYFSTELKNVKGVYTIPQYWASFGVIMFLSIVLLTLFGYLSDTVEGKTIYRSLLKTFYRSSADRLQQRKEHSESNVQ